MSDDIEAIGEALLSKVMVRAEGVIAFTSDQLVDLAMLTDDMARAIGGDTRVALHVEAQLRLRKFTAETRAYLEVSAVRKAIADAVLEVVGALVSQGAKLAGKALAGALTGL